jgi:PAS domain S-box-containing protein
MRILPYVRSASAAGTEASVGESTKAVERSDAAQYAQRAIAPAIALDLHGRILIMNQHAGELLGYRPRQVAGRGFDELLQPRDVFGNPLLSAHATFTAMALRGEAVHHFDLELRTAASEPVRVAVSVVILCGPGNEPSGIVYLLSPVRRRRRADEAIERVLQEAELYAPLGHGRVAVTDPPTPQLTRRQIEVLRLLAEGKSREEISKALNISIHTARSHIQNIYSTLSVHNGPEAILVAVQSRIL